MPAIHANLVVLAIDVVLAVVGVLPIVAISIMSFTMTMTTPVFHGYDSIAGILLGVESAIANQWVFVGIWQLLCLTVSSNVAYSVKQENIFSDPHNDLSYWA